MPHWVVSVIPLAATIIIYNGFKVNVVIALAVNIILCIVLFWKYYKGGGGLKELLNPVPKQAAELLLQVGAWSSWSRGRRITGISFHYGRTGTYADTGII